jgi:uncharacterized glyoxalase superfamily metalloenzyme YdcJ
MNTTARQLATDLLSQRNIFSSELLNILRIAEEKQSRRLTRKQAKIWIREAMHTFSWKPSATASKEVYEILKSEHPILADVA